MTLAFDIRPARTMLRAAGVSLVALFAMPSFTAPAGAAPARPGALSAQSAPVEMVAARKVYRSAKAKRGRTAKRGRYARRGRYSAAPAVFGAVASGLIGAAIAGAYRDDEYEDAPVYVENPYGYGYGYGYRYRRPHVRYDGGDGYDRRYWRGGAPRHVAPQPGYAPARPVGPPQGAVSRGGPVGGPPGFAAPGFSAPRGGYRVRNDPGPTPGRTGGDGTSASPGM